MAKLLKHQQAADTKLTCAGEDNEETTEIPVHSCLIAARSEVLESMITLNDDNTTPNSPSNVPQVSTFLLIMQV